MWKATNFDQVLPKLASYLVYFDCCRKYFESGGGMNKWRMARWRRSGLWERLKEIRMNGTAALAMLRVAGWQFRTTVVRSMDLMGNGDSNKKPPENRCEIPIHG